MRGLVFALFVLACAGGGAVVGGIGAVVLAEWIKPDPPGGHGGPGNVVFLFLGAPIGFALGLFVGGVVIGLISASGRDRRARRAEDDFDDRNEVGS